jgi:hypothetical protein
MRHLVLATIVAMASPVSHAQTYRCTMDGKTVYQQQPCEGGAKLKTEVAPDPRSREFQVSRAIALKQVIVGMTTEELLRSRGKPFHIANVQASNGPADVWYYDKNSVSPRQSVMVRKGLVVNVQQ